MLPTTSVVKITQNRYIPTGFSAAVNVMYGSKTVYRQKKPYTLNLPYSMWLCSTVSWKIGYALPDIECNNGRSGIGSTAFNHVNAFPQNTNFSQAQNLLSTITNKARERFVSTMKGSAGLGVDIAEYKQSMGMIEKRALQMFDFMRALHKGRISHAARLLGVTDHPTYHKVLRNLTIRGQIRKSKYKNQILLKRKAQKAFLTPNDKTYSDLFLEFHFGWSPIVADVYDSVDVLSRDIPSGRVIGRAKGSEFFDLSSTSPGGSRYVNTHEINVDVVVGCTVSVSNPNLALANQLGIINPATLIFEVIPFSFVADWFSNISAYLTQFTEFAGYKLTDPFTRVYTRDFTNQSNYVVATKQFGSGCTMVGHGASRVLSIAGIVLKTNDSWRVSPMRAATAIALLVQQGFGR